MNKNPYIRYDIKTISQGELVQENESWSLFGNDGNKINRVWILGFITQRIEGENNYIGIKVEDGTGAIFVKSWDGKLEPFNQWSKIEILGSIRISSREENTDVFISPDIVTAIDNDNWILVHKLKTLKNSLRQSQIPQDKNITMTQSTSDEEDLKSKIMQVIRGLDDGKGVSYEKIIEQIQSTDEEDIRRTVDQLLIDGDLFERRSGWYSSAVD